MKDKSSKKSDNVVRMFTCPLCKKRANMLVRYYIPGRGNVDMCKQCYSKAGK